jgi:hypothetical protein
MNRERERERERERGRERERNGEGERGGGYQQHATMISGRSVSMCSYVLSLNAAAKIKKKLLKY